MNGPHTHIHTTKCAMTKCRCHQTMQCLMFSITWCKICSATPSLPLADPYPSAGRSWCLWPDGASGHAAAPDHSKCLSPLWPGGWRWARSGCWTFGRCGSPRWQLGCRWRWREHPRSSHSPPSHPPSSPGQGCAASLNTKLNFPKRQQSTDAW